jgi:hypothetical protein
MAVVVPETIHVFQDLTKRMNKLTADRDPSAGSAKTTLVGLKLMLLLENWHDAYSGVCVGCRRPDSDRQERGDLIPIWRGLVTATVLRAP